MLVYRIVLKKWATTLQASGYAARWNSNGVMVLYTSENMSLACLENLVHRKGFGFNNSYEIMYIHIPDQLKIETLKAEDLPKGWKDITEKGSELCRKIGDQWVKSGRTCLLRVPSVIIPMENNILLNCNHKDFDKITIQEHKVFEFDGRF